METKEQRAIEDLQAEVALLRELAIFLVAQLPNTQERADAMSLAYQNAKGAVPERVDQVISFWHPYVKAWQAARYPQLSQHG